MPEKPPQKTSNLRFMLRTFRYRNYRLFFAGQIVSLIGTWLSMVATNWLVYRLASSQNGTDPAIVLGLVGFAGQLPIFLLAPFAGVWVDRISRRCILITTQALAMLQSFALAGLAWSELITIWHIAVLNTMQGVINAIDMPPRQAFVVEIVEDRKDLSGAIALNSSMVHSARFLGPLAAGMLIYAVGEAACFAIDGISYFAVLVALWMMRVSSAPQPAERRPAIGALREGLQYAFGFPPIRVLLTLVALTSLMIMPLSVLMPIFADQILGGGERTLGMLLGASGIGALGGSLYLASRRTVVGLGTVMVAACGILGATMIVFATSRNLFLSVAVLTVWGSAMVVQMASANTLLQTIVDDDKRGRVMSLFTMCFIGMAPFGSLLAGTLAGLAGAPWTIALTGLVCFGIAARFALLLPEMRRLVRPIFIKKGILPPLADGLQSSATVAAISPE